MPKVVGPAASPPTYKESKASQARMVQCLIRMGIVPDYQDDSPGCVFVGSGHAKHFAGARRSFGVDSVVAQGKKGSEISADLRRASRGEALGSTTGLASDTARVRAGAWVEARSPSWPPPPPGWQFWQEARGGNNSPGSGVIQQVGVESPGVLERWKAARASRRKQRDEHRRAQASEHERQGSQAALNHWQAHADAIADTLEAAKEFTGLDQNELADGFVLKKAERAYALVQQAALIEPRRAPGHYEGGYQGFSVRIVKGVRYHAGGTRGHYVPGPESPTIIDNGDVLITDQRVMFRGLKQSREWAFAKLLGYSPSPDRQWMALQVSNRQKVSGIAYGTAIADMVEHRLQLALATFQGERDQLIARLENEMRAHLATKPLPPAQVVG